jgi:purine-nucleoside phosphorylase
MEAIRVGVGSMLSFGEFTRLVSANPPHAALILGSGMGDLADRCEILGRVNYNEIPGIPATSVVGHRGSLALGVWAGRRTLLFEGRLHRYEGHPWEAVVQPVRIAHQLGVPVLLLTNAAGGIGDSLNAGSLMAIRDHLEWTWSACWNRPGPGGLGDSRPSPYDPELLKMLQKSAADLGIELATGVYAALTGPCYETKAEILALKAWGADAVGMSTAREIQLGSELGMKCAAISLITNKAAGLSNSTINHEEVLVTAKAQAERLSELIKGFLGRLGSN